MLMNLATLVGPSVLAEPVALVEPKVSASGSLLGQASAAAVAELESERCSATAWTSETALRN